MIGQWPPGFKRIEFPLNKALQSPKHSKELLKLGPPLFVFQDFLFCFVPTDDEHSCHGHSCFHEKIAPCGLKNAKELAQEMRTSASLTRSYSRSSRQWGSPALTLLVDDFTIIS